MVSAAQEHDRPAGVGCEDAAQQAIQCPGWSLNGFCRQTYKAPFLRHGKWLRETGGTAARGFRKTAGFLDFQSVSV